MLLPACPLHCRNNKKSEEQAWVLSFTLQHWARGQLLLQEGFARAEPVSLVRLDLAGEWGYRLRPPLSHRRRVYCLRQSRVAADGVSAAGYRHYYTGLHSR
jgi:hypothetical protein